MDTPTRSLFNHAFNDELFGRYMRRLEAQLGTFPFRVAETPLFLTALLRDQLAKSAVEIVGQLSEPTLLTRLKQAVPAQYDVAGMDELPNCVQVDFALTRNPATEQLEGKVVELQAFPSLYALMTLMSDAWSAELQAIPGLAHPWSCFIGQDRKESLELMRAAIVGDCDPAEVALVDLEPELQKTSPDFAATKVLFGVDPVCLTKLVKEGRSLFRKKDGKLVPVKRIYNRMVFDELEVKGAKLPFQWNDDLDVTWCSHPNWYWVWSKYALPFIDHTAVPKAQFLSAFFSAADGVPAQVALPDDLDGFVLKPLFSFAGAGVVLDVTREVILAIPAGDRGRWVLQNKIEYVPVLSTPDGHGVKAEVRVMLIRPPHSTKLVPLICLVRLSRGKMLGVDFNKGLTWIGGSVGMWNAG